MNEYTFDASRWPAPFNQHFKTDDEAIAHAKQVGADECIVWENETTFYTVWELEDA